MPKLETKRNSELSRKELSERLITLGQALARGSEVELGSGGDSISVVVADRVRWELEIEVEGDQTEIEIEIRWRDQPSDKSEADPPWEAESEPAVPVKAARRGRPRKSTAN